ncbi:hypothetical protein V2J09_017211 [Rumex salicifolius]
MENNAVIEGDEVTNGAVAYISCHVEQEKQHQQSGGEDEKSLPVKNPEVEDEELRKLLLSDIGNLPLYPPSIVESNFARYFAPDFIKPGHDQYIYRHANGLCVIGLAPAHVALQAGVSSVDFNVGKSDRSEFKVTGKRKKNAQHFESNTALCKVSCGDDSYVVRCCVKGSLLEVNNRLIKNPELLNRSADRDGYIAIIMPRPADWLKIKETLVSVDEYSTLRKLV